MTKRVYVAMSGGVDSSVAAALLKDQGYEVTGVFMKFWSAREGDFCLWREERRDAALVAAKLNIPFLTWDFTKEYGKKVVDYMVEAYRSGITPNPDIMCNKEIKFGMFFDQAINEGADFVATGHYARIARENTMPNSEVSLIDGRILTPDQLRGKLQQIGVPQDDSNNEYQLLKAIDPNKDQSYFLYTLEQRHLERTLFPIGSYLKSEVRELAKRYDLPTAEKKDSQGVCFIGPLEMKKFLMDYIKPKKGLVAHRDGRVLGQHDGAYYYTIGQRHGIDLKLAGGPYYVVSKDINQNIIYVGDEADLYSDQTSITNVHWIGGAPKLPANLGVKIRYRSESVPVILGNKETVKQFNNKSATRKVNNTDLIIKFNSAVRAITPGQAAVFYDGEKVLGGGIITNPKL